MLKLIPPLLLALSAVLVKGQTTVSGRIRDNRGRPLSGASIALRDTYDGAVSDSLGNYHFKTAEKGEQTLVVSSVGFKPAEQRINLGGSFVKADISLREAPNELSAVTITAGTFEASDTKRTTVLNSIDIVTTASANGDVTSAIKTLPGAQQVGESEGLFVRGGTAEETKVFIDGTRVNNFFYSSVPDIAQRGRFSPLLFKGTVFSSGGYSALYGDALSAALILESTDLPDRSSASVGISSVGISGGFQQLAKKKNASWGVNYSYLNLAAYFAAVKQRPDYITIPEFNNGEMNFRVKTSATGRPYYNLRQDRTDGTYKISDQGTTISYNNLSLSVNYLPFIGSRSAKRFIVLVLSANNVLGSDQVFNYNYSYDGLRREAIVPPSRRFYFIGCFMSFGVDRSEDVINSNL